MNESLDLESFNALSIHEQLQELADLHGLDAAGEIGTQKNRVEVPWDTVAQEIAKIDLKDKRTESRLMFGGPDVFCEPTSRPTPGLYPYTVRIFKSRSSDYVIQSSNGTPVVSQKNDLYLISDDNPNKILLETSWEINSRPYYLTQDDQVDNTQRRDRTEQIPGVGGKIKIDLDRKDLLNDDFLNCIKAMMKISKPGEGKTISTATGKYHRPDVTTLLTLLKLGFKPATQNGQKIVDFLTSGNGPYKLVQDPEKRTGKWVLVHTEGESTDLYDENNWDEDGYQGQGEVMITLILEEEPTKSSTVGDAQADFNDALKKT